MTNQLQRAAEVADFTGRTLEGPAYRYSVPSRVTDNGWATSYFEEMLKACDVKTLADRSSFPLVRLHSSQGGKPVGAVTFSHSADEKALMFTAHVDRSAQGDQLLQDIEQWKDVSVTFDALRSTQRRSEHHGPIVQRAEIRLVELALAPTGTGLVKGAEVQVVRSSVLETPRLEAVRKRLILL